MKLKSIAANQTEITLANGTRVFFSYETPVAAIVEGKSYRTEQKWSATTSRHISKWCGNAETKPQEFFDKLAA